MVAARFRCDEFGLVRSAKFPFLVRDCTMLVLSRKVGEKILIGDDIAVTVVRIAQGIVRIGVEAPTELPIVREEIKDQLKKDPQGQTPAAR